MNIEVTEREKNELWFVLTAISTPKEDLIRKLGVSDRRLRAIASAINSDESNDHLVLTDTDKGGYWKAVRGVDSAPAVNHFYEEESRAMNTMRKAHAIRRKIVNLYGQEAIDPNVKLQGRLF